MALPNKLKDFNLFGDGANWLGLVPSITLPEMARNMSEYRGGGMDGPIEIDMGGNLIECTWTIAGITPDEVLNSYGAPAHDAAQLRITGSYESDETGSIIPVEIVLRGRHKTLGGTDKSPGEDADQEITTSCSYYKLVVNGVEKIAEDRAAGVFRVNGTDRYAERRAALGV